MTKFWRYIPANPVFIYKNFGDWVANERRKEQQTKLLKLIQTVQNKLVIVHTKV